MQHSGGKMINRKAQQKKTYFCHTILLFIIEIICRHYSIFKNKENKMLRNAPCMQLYRASTQCFGSFWWWWKTGKCAFDRKDPAYSCFPQRLAAEFSHEGVQARVCGSQSHRLHRYDQRLRRGRLPKGQSTGTVAIRWSSECKCRIRSKREREAWLLSPLQHLLFGSLGRSLACADPPESERLTILNEAWKVVTKVRSPQVPLRIMLFPRGCMFVYRESFRLRLHMWSFVDFFLGLRQLCWDLGGVHLPTLHSE